MLGASGAVVSTVTLRAVEATPVLPAASVAVAVRLWRTVGEGTGGVAPGAGAIGGGGTEQGGAVIDLDGAAGFGGAIEGQRVVAGDVVADGAGVGGEGGDAGGQRGRGIDSDVEGGGGHPRVAGRVGGGGGKLWRTIVKQPVV